MTTKTKENISAFWDTILSGKKIISDKEAAEMQQMLKELRRKSQK